MPAVCQHCGQLVAVQPECPNCGRPMVAGKLAASKKQPAGMGEVSGYLVMALGLVLGIILIGVVLVALIYWLL